MHAGDSRRHPSSLRAELVETHHDLGEMLASELEPTPASKRDQTAGLMGVVPQHGVEVDVIGPFDGGLEFTFEGLERPQRSKPMAFTVLVGRRRREQEPSGYLGVALGQWCF